MNLININFHSPNEISVIQGARDAKSLTDAIRNAVSALLEPAVVSEVAIYNVLDAWLIYICIFAMQTST